MSPTLFMFERRGWVELAFPTGKKLDKNGVIVEDPLEPALSVDDVFEPLVDLGVEDIVEESPEEVAKKSAKENIEKVVFVYADVQDTSKVAQNLKDEIAKKDSPLKSVKIKDMGIEYSPTSDALVSAETLDESTLAAFQKLYSTLEDLDDVVEVYTNLD